MNEIEAFAESVRTPTILLGMLALIVQGLKASVDLVVQFVNLKRQRKQVAVTSLRMILDLINAFPGDEGVKARLRSVALREVPGVPESAVLKEIRDAFSDSR